MIQRCVCVQSLLYLSANAVTFDNVRGFYVKSYMKDLAKNEIIPAQVDGYPVIGIGYKAF